jgi:hypothetical protein
MQHLKASGIPLAYGQHKRRGSGADGKLGVTFASFVGFATFCSLDSGKTGALFMHVYFD